MKKKLVLIVSSKMDSNKKEGRNENGLVRMSATTRKNMGFTDTVELWPTGGVDERVRGATTLGIFQAFKKDLENVKKMTKEGELTPSEASRVGFVTSKTFNKICGPKSKKSARTIWISDSIHDTLIGADPEFLLFEGDQVINASNVMPKPGEIGSDGAMAEVRPKPEITANKLVSNIQGIFGNEVLTNRIRDYRWITACYHKDNRRDYPVGGHIHIGNPIQLIKAGVNRKKSFFKVMNKIMDELLALPMVKVDGRIGKSRRTECKMGKYGFFGEMRECDGRLEHRTLSGMWLLHPSLARAVLGTAKAIIDETYRKAATKDFQTSYILPSKFNRAALLWDKNFDQWDEIPLADDMRCTKTSAEIIDVLNSSDSRLISAAFIRDWFSKMKGMSTFKENEDAIRALYEVLKISTKELAGWSREIKENWLRKKKFLVDL
jgi:hypothetical protein